MLGTSRMPEPHYWMQQELCIQLRWGPAAPYGCSGMLAAELRCSAALSQQNLDYSMPCNYSVTLGKSHFSCVGPKVKNKRNIFKNKHPESEYSCKFLLWERKKWEKKLKLSYVPKVSVLFCHPPCPLLSKQQWRLHVNSTPQRASITNSLPFWNLCQSTSHWRGKKQLVLLGFGSACHDPGSCFTPKANMPT